MARLAASLLLPLAFFAALPAWANPLRLRAEAVVAGDTVTLGDLVEDAGPFAPTPLFRAPIPGGVGTISAARIEAAARELGLAGLGADGPTARRQRWCAARRRCCLPPRRKPRSPPRLPPPTAAWRARR
jgi:hypothetical protein